MAWRAIRAFKDEQGFRVETVDTTVDELSEGDVTVAVEYSTVNYKDGLALAGKDIIRRYPLIPGIDLAGTVVSSTHTGFAEGDRVVLNGYGVGETHDGGFAQRARVRGDWLVPLPANLSTRQAAAIGTAGYTAMLSVLALQDAGVTPDDGEVLVTGAAGGVGSVAVALLARLGYQVLAATGRPQEEQYLRDLGATGIVERAQLSEPGRALASERWAGAVDTVGSHTLVNVLAATRYGGVVTACGLAQGSDLPATVMPFILRGVTLAGIDSVQAPMTKRVRAYERLARDLDPTALTAITSVVGLDEVPEVGRRILAGQVRGRTVVDVNG